jgi:hypothetical protein
MRLRILVPLLALSLAACDDDKAREPGSAASLPTLSAGSSQLLLNGDDAGRSATAFVADSGAGYLVLQADSDEPAAVIYRRSKGSAWRRVPAASSVLSLNTLHGEALPVQSPPSPEALTGNYRASIAAKVVAVVLAEDGRLSGDAGDCRLGGAIDAAKTLGNAATVKATLIDCGEASGSYAGIAWADAEAPNAALRMVLDDGRRVQDFFLFPE